MLSRMLIIVTVAVAGVLVTCLLSPCVFAQTKAKDSSKTKATTKKASQKQEAEKKVTPRKTSATKGTQKKVTTTTKTTSKKTTPKTTRPKTLPPKAVSAPSERIKSPSRGPASREPNRALMAAFHRIVMARMYQDTWTLPGETPETVGKALASLKPSTVAGLIRLGSSDDTADSTQQGPSGAVISKVLSAEQVAAFNMVRKEVRAVNPECRFDFVLDAKSYSTPDAILTQMKDINVKVRPDLWFFDSLTSAYKANPAPIDAAIAYAHSQGQAVGGDCYSAQLPSGMDYAVVEAMGFKFDVDHIRKIRDTYRIPVIAHLNNLASNQGKDEEPKQFIQTLTPEKRAAVIAHLASGQTAGQYALMYPVFFPEYPRHQSYNATKDGAILDTFRATMDQFNP